MGIPSPLRLGIQRQVVVGFSGAAASTRAHSVGGCCPELWRRARFRSGLDDSGGAPTARGNGYSYLCGPAIRAAAASTQDQGCTPELSNFCPYGLHLGSDRGIARDLGGFGCKLLRNLGRIAPCADR